MSCRHSSRLYQVTQAKTACSTATWVYGYYLNGSRGFPNLGVDLFEFYNILIFTLEGPELSIQ
jgi:hypothetical protein